MDTSPIDQLLEEFGIKYPRCGAHVPDGWFSLIRPLIEELIAAGWDKELDQIKEKFGGLRFYVGNTNDVIRQIISRTEALSFKTCEVCGAEGKRRAGGWILTLCDKHAKDRNA